MSGMDGIHITEATVKDWEKQAAALKEKIAAARLLLRANGVSSPMPASKPKGAGDANMTALLADIANAASRPVPKADMRKRLVDAGVAADRLGKYFYVVIAKLKKAQKITVQKDGSLWRGPKYERA